jgi:hypothetical protein
VAETESVLVEAIVSASSTKNPRVVNGNILVMSNNRTREGLESIFIVVKPFVVAEETDVTDVRAVYECGVASDRFASVQARPMEPLQGGTATEYETLGTFRPYP